MHLDLLTQLVSPWRYDPVEGGHEKDATEPGDGYFEVGGTHLRISLEDIYFLMGLPITRVRTNPLLIFLAGTTMEDLAVGMSEGGVAGLSLNNTIKIRTLSDPLIRIVASIMSRVVRSGEPERIGGGRLLLVERAIAGTQYAWGP